MLALTILGFCYIVFVIFDLLPLWRNRDWKLLGLYSGLMLSSWFLAALLTGYLSLPSPEPFLNEVLGRLLP